MNATPLMVSAPWLADHLKTPNLAVIDCRFQLTAPDLGYQQYLDSHIEGASYLNLDRDLSAPVERHGGRHPLPNSDHLARKLASIGVIFGKTHVIAYDASRFAFASRFWWLMRYLGHDRVSLLDGGWQGWLTAGYPVSTTVPTPKTGRFAPNPHPEWTVDRDGVKARQDSPAVVLIDSREGDRYRGEREPIDPIAGHIEGAINLPWTEVTDEQGFIQPLDVHQQRWKDHETRDEIIVYCGSGVTACVNLLSLSLAGYDNVKLYSGGWSDWCSYRR